MKTTVMILLVVLACFSFLSLPLSPRAEAATIAHLEPMVGPVGELVKFTGSVVCGGNFMIYWDSISEENLLVQGKATACAYAVTNFRVPETYKGRHRVILVDLEGGDEASHDFTVIPEIKASVSKGPVATVAIMNATGFAANEADIQVTYDGSVVTSGIASSIKGSWRTTITIPESPKGEHLIQASGALTNASEVGYISFEVVPKISLEPALGGIGATITVSGTGFASGEADIKITFNDLPAKAGITANSLGSFSTTFTVPNTNKKENAVDVFIRDAKVAEASNVIFTVGTAVTLEPAFGYVGHEVTVLGSGFAPGETSIKLIYDDTEIATSVTADTNGVWKTTFAVPDSTAGSHLVTAYGNTTLVKNVKSQYFIVLPRLSLSSTSREGGTTIIATGTGFGKSQPLTIMYDDIQLSLDINTDTKGSFTAEFKAPVSPGEEHQVNATDGAGNGAAANFFTETTPPSTPSPLSPAPKARVGFMGKQAVTFEWSEVSDPSGVSYTLEISQEADFQSPVLQGRDLIENHYTLAETEALEQGSYYWRVKAVDGAGNESNWTTAQPFTVSGLKLNILPIIVVLVILMLIVVLWVFTPVFRRKE